MESQLNPVLHVQTVADVLDRALTTSPQLTAHAPTTPVVELRLSVKVRPAAVHTHVEVFVVLEVAPLIAEQFLMQVLVAVLKTKPVAQPHVVELTLTPVVPLIAAQLT